MVKDIAETKDVSAENPEIVQQFKAQIDVEAKKIGADAKKAGGKVTEESKKAAGQVKKAGEKAAQETKKAAKKVKSKI